MIKMGLVTAELNGSGEIVHHEDGTIEFEMKSTEDWMPRSVMEKVASHSVNLPVFWRHRTPQKPGYNNYPVIGRVVSSRVGEDGALYNKYRIGGSLLHEKQTTARDWILQRWKEDRKIGASISTYAMRDVDNTVIDAETMEYSITPSPHFETCQREKEMPEKTADELQAELDEARVELETKAKELDAKEKSITERENALAVELEKKADTIDTLRAKIEENERSFHDLMVEKEKSFNERLLEMERKPLVARCLELEDEKVVKLYDLESLWGKTEPEKLREILSELEAREKPAPQIRTMTVEKERGESAADRRKSYATSISFLTEAEQKKLLERYDELEGA